MEHLIKIFKNNKQLEIVWPYWLECWDEVEKRKMEITKKITYGYSKMKNYY